MTLRELSVEFETHAEQAFHQTERDAILAWQIVRVWAMTRSKKRLPKLSDVLPKRKAGAQSVAQMKAAAEVIMQQFGKGIVRLHRKVGKD